jgi:hypothetical protein
MEIKFELSSSEYKNLTSYCKLNNLNPDLIVKKSYLEGFRIEKYGLLSGSGGTIEKEVIKEVIKYVEVPVVEEKEVVRIEYVEIEKPVEVEKIVEVIKEVPVDRVVIKEIPIETVVTKIEYICDNSETNKLLLKIQELENRPPETVEIIKEVIVEKETTDNSLKPKLDALQNTVQKLKQDNIDKDKLIREYEQTIKDIQVHQQGTKALYLRGSNLDEKLYNNK